MQNPTGRTAIEACRFITRAEQSTLGKDAVLPPIAQPTELTGRMITAAWLRARCLICGECEDMAA